MEENLQRIDERIGEILEDLGRTQIGSQEYSDKVKDLVEENKVRESMVKTELQRVDNNAKNDISEAELVIKQQEVKTNKLRNFITILTTIITVGGYCGTSIYEAHHAYENEKTQIGDKGWLRSSDQAKNRIK